LQTFVEHLAIYKGWLLISVLQEELQSWGYMELESGNAGERAVNCD
jgi:hypothetical protein